MTTPAVRPASSLNVRNIAASTIEVDELAKLGDSNGAGVGFFGVAPTNQPQALTAPVVTGVADLATVPTADAADLPTVIALANALKADRNGPVQNLANSVKFVGNNNSASLGEIRDALGEVAGVGLVDITP